MKSKKSFSTVGIFLLVSILVGALSGVTASVITNQSIDRYISDLQNSDELVHISQQKPRPLPGTYEEALGRVMEVGLPSLAYIRRASTDSTAAQNWFTVDDMAGVGAVITSDGWVLFHEDAMDAVGTQGEVWVRRERFAIERTVRDTRSPFVLVKIAARDVPALAFGSSDFLAGGEILFGLDGGTDMRVTSLEDAFAGRATVERAEISPIAWELSSAFERPAPLFTTNGELVGFAIGEREALPIHHAVPFVQSVLRTGNVAHTGLGVYVADIESTYGMDAAVRGNARSGALVVAPRAGVAAVTAGSPAANAGLMAGDILISLNGVQINQKKPLADILSGYSAGDNVNIRLLRSGSEMDISVGLGVFSP